MPNPQNAARAQRHAALTPRLAALAGQLQAVALRKPGEPVSATVQSLAEDLLFEAREFRPPGERRGLPAAAPDHAGLAAQLGQALALLALWQARHETPGVGRTETGEPGEDMDALRRKLALRIERHNAGIFEAGRRAALAEKPEPDQADDKIYPRFSGLG